jgi:hypothetical protein
VRSWIPLTIASSLAAVTLAAPVGAAPDLHVYASINWEGNGKPVVAPKRFDVKYQAQDLTMVGVTWHGWGTRLATGHGESWFNSGPREKVTLYMGGGFTRCDNGKRYYKTLAAVGQVTANFPNEPGLISSALGAKASPRKGLIWHTNCTGGPLATTGYWSRLG